MKGQIAMNTLIKVLILIVILIVMIAIISGRLGLFKRSVMDCESKGGECTKPQDCEYVSYASKSCEEGEVCCINPAGD